MSSNIKLNQTFISIAIIMGSLAAIASVVWADCSQVIPGSDEKCSLSHHTPSNNYSIKCHKVDTDDQLAKVWHWVWIQNLDPRCRQHELTSDTLQDFAIKNSNSSAVIQWIQTSDAGQHIRSLTIDQTIWSSKLPDKLFATWDQLEVLNLNNNGLREFVAVDVLSPKSRIQSLDLSHNEIQSVDLSGHQMMSLATLSLANNSLERLAPLPQPLRSISLALNPWQCDDESIGFLRYVVNESVPIRDRDDITCRSPTAAKDMKFAQRLSVFETPVCSHCECTVLRNKDVIAVNCSERRLRSLPTSLPSVTKIVRLDNNDIRNISLSGPPSAVSQWRNVSYLHLNNNTIESLAGLERTKLLKGLVALHISRNRLREIPVYILDQLSHLDELYLSDNPWRCDCHTVPFQMWLQNHFKSVKDVYSIRCAADPPAANRNDRNGVYSENFDKRFANRVLLRIPKSELCPKSQSHIDVFEIINWLLASIIVLVIVKLIYDYFWQKRTGKLPEFFKLNIN